MRILREAKVERWMKKNMCDITDINELHREANKHLYRLIDERDEEDERKEKKKKELRRIE